jgi:Na+/H+ antiporter NhaD/arsenite permease-like protein
MISGLLAALSMILVPPTATYLSYIDFRVLALLFCLMAVVAGFDETGIFVLLSEKLLMKVANTRSISFVLVMLCFLSSMWITNDVALITFVPFAILILTMTDQMDHLIPIIVLQTIAANLGSMLTPVGNPQNLYLYSYYNVPIGEFFGITLPFVALSALLLCICTRFIPKEHISFTLHNDKRQTVTSLPVFFFMNAFFWFACLCIEIP